LGSSKWLVVLLLAMLLALHSFSVSGGNGLSVEVEWVTLLSHGFWPASVCSIGDFLYVIGSSGSPPDYMFVVEARFKANGSLVKTWTFNPTNLSDNLISCVAFKDKLYIVGVENVNPYAIPQTDSRWAIIILSADLSLVKYATYNPSPGEDSPRAILAVGGHLYIVGRVDIYGAERRYRVELRDPETLEPVKGAELTGIPIHVKFNKATGELWVLKLSSNGSEVDIISGNLEYIKTVNTKRLICRSLAFDDEGNAYIACERPGALGEATVDKLDKNGNRIKSTTIQSTSEYWLKPKAVEAYGDYILLAGDKVRQKTIRPTLLVLDRSLSVIEEKTIAGEDQYTEYPIATVTKMLVEGDKIYLLGGLGRSLDDLGIRVLYSLTVRASEASEQKTTITKTVTQTLTIKETLTTTKTITLTQVQKETITLTQKETILKEYTITQEITTTLTKTPPNTETPLLNIKDALAGFIAGILITTPIILILTRKHIQ